MATKSKFHTQDGIKTLGNAEIDGSLTVSGNFTVNGTQTIIDSTTSSITDSMIELASGNTSSDTIDVGIYGNYNDGLSGEGDVSEYTGLFRDATDSTWKLYDGLEVEPTTTVNTSGSGFTFADLQVGDLTATTLTATNSITGSSITYPTTDGTNGQVITTNGSGTLSFGDIPAGYTDSDARSAISVSGDLSYNSSTGVISYSDSDTTYTDSDARSALSAGTGISYNSSTGVITNTVTNTDTDTTYSAGTGLSLTGTTFSSTITQYADSDVESYLSGGTGVTYSSGAISIGQAVATSDSPSFAGLTLTGTGALQTPVGTTEQRPTAANGLFRYNSDDAQFEGYADGAWGAIAGGGGGSAMETNNFTGDGTTTAFTLSSNVANEDNLIAFIEGVYQNKSDFVASGTTITFDTAPVSGRNIVVYHIRASISGSSVIQNAFTGDGSDTTFTLSVAQQSENNTQVYLNGVYQNKDTYSVSGTTLTFSEAPANTVAIEVIMFAQTSINEPAAGTVATATIQEGAVTSAKLDTNIVIAGTLGVTGAITSSNAKFGVWSDSGAYSGIFHTSHASSSYGMLFDATNTFVGSGTGGSVYIRYDNNASANQLVVNSSGWSMGSTVVMDGSRNLVNIGTISSGATTMTGLTITAATPSIQMTDSDNNADAYIQATY